MAQAALPARGRYSAPQIRASMRLYGVTDRAWLGRRTLAECVEAAIAGGATFIQLREKRAARQEIAQLARELLAICRRAGVPFVIDDEVDLAREVGADGVHVGQEDMACRMAREVLGPEAIVGVSVQTVEEAIEAERQGADYLGVGAVIYTPTKPDAVLVSHEELCAICQAVSIPVVAIGGLNANTIGQLAGAGVDGVAVVSALFAADDVRAAAEDLRRCADAIATGAAQPNAAEKGAAAPQPGAASRADGARRA